MQPRSLNYGDPGKTVERLTQSRDGWDSFYSTLGAFLQKAFPAAAAEASEFIGVARAMNSHNANEAISDHLVMMSMYPAAGSLGPEYLVKLGAERDTLAEQIERVESGVSKIPSEMREFLGEMALGPLRWELLRVDEQIAGIQDALLKPYPGEPVRPGGV